MNWNGKVLLIYTGGTIGMDVNPQTGALELYGIMMLRLQKKEITPETANAIKEITTLVGLLSDYYIKDRTEGLKFEDD